MIELEGCRGEDGIPYVGAIELECFARDMTRDLDGDLLTKAQETNVERVIRDALHAHLDVRPLTAEGTIGGMTVFGGGEVPVYDPEAGQYRRKKVAPRTILIERRLAEAVENGQYRLCWRMRRRIWHATRAFACRSEAGRFYAEWEQNNADPLPGKIALPKAGSNGRPTIWRAPSSCRPRRCMPRWIGNWPNADCRRTRADGGR